MFGAPGLRFKGLGFPRHVKSPEGPQLGLWVFTHNDTAVVV